MTYIPNSMYGHGTENPVDHGKDIHQNDRYWKCHLRCHPLGMRVCHRGWRGGGWTYWVVWGLKTHVDISNWSTDRIPTPPYIPVCVHVWNMYMCVYIYIYMYTYMNEYMYKCIHIYICVYKYMCIYIHIYLCVCVCVCVCAHVYTRCKCVCAQHHQRCDGWVGRLGVDQRNNVQIHACVYTVVFVPLFCVYMNICIYVPVCIRIYINICVWPNCMYTKSINIKGTLTITMYMYMYMYMYMFMYIYIHVHVYIYIYTHIYVYIYIYFFFLFM